MKSITAILFLPAVLWMSCKDKSEKPQMVPEVTVVEAGQKTVPVYSEYVGQTYGQSDIEIRPRVEGWVQSMHFKEGSPVQKGQLLYVIQDNELRDREQSAKAQLAEANIMLSKAKNDLD